MTIKQLKALQYYYVTSQSVVDQALAAAYLQILKYIIEENAYSEEQSEHVRISRAAEELKKYNQNPMVDQAYDNCIIVYANQKDFKAASIGFKGKTKEDYIKFIKRNSTIYNRIKTEDLNTQWGILELAIENEND